MCFSSSQLIISEPPKVGSRHCRDDASLARAMARGSTARLVRRARGKTVQGTLMVTEYEPVRVFAAVSQFGPFTLLQRAVFEPVPDGRTRLRLMIDTRAAGGMRLLLPLLKPQFRKTMARSLLSIKEQVEAQTPG
jgi:hypothetical protein